MVQLSQMWILLDNVIKNTTFVYWSYFFFFNLISLNRISLREEIPGVESEDPEVKSQNKCKNEGYFWFQVT